MATKMIHLVSTVRSNYAEDGGDAFVDPIGCYDNLGDAVALSKKIKTHKPVKGIKYDYLNDFDDCVVISLPLNGTIRHDQ
jgi:hypothetical protein